MIRLIDRIFRLMCGSPSTPLDLSSSLYASVSADEPCALDLPDLKVLRLPPELT
jgi:hypothetical protein